MKACVGVVLQLRPHRPPHLLSKRYPGKANPHVPLLLFKGDREGNRHLLTHKLEYYGKS